MMKSTSILPPVEAPAGIDAVITEAIRNRLAARALPWQGQAPVELPPPANVGKIRCKAGLPGRRRALAIRSVCGVVRMISGEMVFLTGGRVPTGRNRRFAMSHIQQIAMYVCHVVLQLTMTDIAAAFGKDRTTVGHACARVEDRRDDGAYDALISAVERIVNSIFGPTGTARS
ncbi:MAG: Chromosomal replication initiator DnaA protein [Rhizobium sp.]|nr:Chromosomal replication initiator DnaA protein [Rhizobium sp.]